jgi:nitroimidazol reductase NimA-like FMN-containing flavoprotein (pyridoxamine 5'-phosphate oxidase superfamily)
MSRDNATAVQHQAAGNPQTDPEPSHEGELRTARTRLNRDRARGFHDREAVYAVLDSVPLCHIAYVRDGVPFVTPTLQWRDGDYVYWHGAEASRFMRQLTQQTVCLTVTRLDGLVLARSAFHHSVNYASAMVFGRPERVTDLAHKSEQLEKFVEHLLPGRWADLREMTRKEANATNVLRMPIEEASVKARSGAPDEDEADRELPIWAGVLPIAWQTGTPVPDPYNPDDLPLPGYLRKYVFQRSD